MCDIDFSFLTDNCRWNEAELRAKLEELCDLADLPYTILDGNLGLPGQWGFTSTIQNATINPLTREITLFAQPRGTPLVINQLVSGTFAINIEPLGFHDSAVQTNVTIANPATSGQSLYLYGHWHLDNNANIGRGRNHLFQLRDVTGGLPGVNIADMQHSHDFSGTIRKDFSHAIPFAIVLAPGATYNQTVRAYVETVTGIGGPTQPSTWNQTIINIVGVGIWI